MFVWSSETMSISVSPAERAFTYPLFSWTEAIFGFLEEKIRFWLVALFGRTVALICQASPIFNVALSSCKWMLETGILLTVKENVFFKTGLWSLFTSTSAEPCFKKTIWFSLSDTFKMLESDTDQFNVL